MRHARRLLLVGILAAVTGGAGCSAQTAWDDWGPASWVPKRIGGSLVTRLPASATAYRHHASGFRATMNQVRFELPAKDLPELMRDLPCKLGPAETATPAPGHVGTNRMRWWTPERSHPYRTCAVSRGPHDEVVVVDLRRDPLVVFLLVENG